MLNSTLVRGTFGALLALVCSSSPAFACEGDDLEEALEIIHGSIDAGHRAARTGNIQWAIERGIELEERAQRLPRSCQELIRTTSQAFRPIYDPGGTRCVGSVSCDGTGCVPN